MRGISENPPKDGDTVQKCVNLQDNIINNVSGHVNDDNLEHYCCINNHNLDQYVQAFTRQPVVLDSTKIDIFHEVISFIKEQFEVTDYTLSTQGNKVKVQSQTSLIRGSKEFL